MQGASCLAKRFLNDPLTCQWLPL